MGPERSRPYPGVPVIDADGHVLEPRDLWAKNLPARYRDQAIGIKWNEETQLEDEWAGGVNIMPGLGTTNGWARLPRSVRDDPRGLRWEDLTAAGRNAKDRVMELNREGIDAAVLYPSLGLVLGGLTDPGHAVAACRIYNDWLAEYVAVAPERLVGIGAIPMQDPTAAVQEAQRAVSELGFHGLFVRPNPVNDLWPHHSVYDPLWGAVADLGVPVGLHPAGFPDTFGAAQLYGAQWKGITPMGKVINFMIDTVTCFTMMMSAGIFDRNPTLKVIVLESGVGWVQWWAEKMDHWYKARLAGPSLELLPSEYVERQVWFSGDPDESSFESVSKVIPPNRLLWASDFPHLDILWDEPSVTEELYERLASMESQVSQQILGLNAQDVYNVSIAAGG